MIRKIINYFKKNWDLIHILVLYIIFISTIMYFYISTTFFS